MITADFEKDKSCTFNINPHYRTRRTLQPQKRDK